MIIYWCSCCHGSFIEEELIDDNYLESLAGGKRCPSCGNGIYLDEFDISQLEEDDDIKLGFESTEKLEQDDS